jgi:hypothetical protein
MLGQQRKKEIKIAGSGIEFIKQRGTTDSVI